MRNYPLFLTLPLVALMTGCGDDDGDNATNPASNVDLIFSTFDLEDVANGPANLQYTRFYDPYRGLEPSDPDSIDYDLHVALAKALRDHVDQYLGHVRNDGDDGYELVRNPLDLMNQVIASGQVANFNAGRQYISDRIDIGSAGVYNTRANGASVRFSDLAATEAGEPLANRQWIYDTLYWNYTPLDQDGNDGYEKVFRVIQYVARADAADDDSATQQLTSLTSSSQFDATGFSVQGYNAPEYTIVSFASRTLGDMELRQDLIDGKVDTLFLKDSGVSLDGDTLDCIRVELEYPMMEVRIYTSNGEPSQYDHDLDEDTDEVDNPAYCGFHEAGDERFVYSGIAIAERQ